MFLWPTTTRRITSHFRPANRRDHHGLDIAEPGTHEVFAAADGTVSRSYCSASYGECVMIVHSINGQTWETVYAHMRSGSRRVKEGQRVKRGQVIGIMGNTGDSTGQHLHFEVHKGRWNINKTNAVNPLNYIGGSNPTASKPPKSKKVTGKKLMLPKTASSWRVYPLNKPPTKGNEVGFLNPKKFGGLEYDILGNPQRDVYTIQTANFGKVNIYAGKETGAKVVSKTATYKNKRLESITKGSLRFYSKPSWNDKDVYGYLKYGQGFPKVLEKIKVEDGYQYKVQNSKGQTFYVTANSKYVKLV